MTGPDPHSESGPSDSLAGSRSGPGPGPRSGRRSPKVGAILALMAAQLRGLARDRTAVFFIVIMPVAVMVIIGMTFGAAAKHVTVGVLDEDRSDTSRQVLDQLRESGSADLTTYRSLAGLRRDVRAGNQVAALVIPAGFGAAASQGREASVRIEAVGDEDVQAVDPIVRAAAGKVGTRLAATAFVMRSSDLDRADASAAVDAAAAESSAVPVEVRTVGDAEFEGSSNFSYTAPSNLVLFLFITALAGGGALVESRRLGLTRRTMAAPVGAGAVIAGFAGVRLLITLGQAGLIIAVGAVVFGVEWGQALGVAVLVIVYALMAVGAGLVVGAVAKNPEQASAIGVPVGIALGMLGGCMWPLDIVPPLLRTIGHLTPQAWAMDGFVGLVFEGATLGGIALNIAVLAGFAAVFLTLGVLLLRRTLARET